MLESKFRSLRATLRHFLGEIRAGFGLFAAPPQRINPDFQRFIARLEEVLELDAVITNLPSDLQDLAPQALVAETDAADLFPQPSPTATLEPMPLVDPVPAFDPAPVPISMAQPADSVEPGEQAAPRTPRKRKPGTRRKPSANPIPASNLNSPSTPKRRSSKKPPAAPSIPDEILGAIHPSQLPPSEPEPATEAASSPMRAPKSHSGRSPAERQPRGRQATLSTDGP